MRAIQSRASLRLRPLALTSRHRAPRPRLDGSAASLSRKTTLAQTLYRAVFAPLDAQQRCARGRVLAFRGLKRRGLKRPSVAGVDGSWHSPTMKDGRLTRGFVGIVLLTSCGGRAIDSDGDMLGAARAAGNSGVGGGASRGGETAAGGRA